MKSKEAKDIRKQLKNVAQAMAPTVLSSEAGTVMYKQLMEAVTGRLNNIELEVRETLAKIDERSKDLQSYAMRQISAMMPIQPQVNVQEEMNEKSQSADSGNLGSSLPISAQGHGSIPKGDQEKV